MDIRGLKRGADEALANCDKLFSRLTAIHVDLIVVFILAFINFNRLGALLGIPMDAGASTEGLSALDDQVLLATVQVVLLILTGVALVFWYAGGAYLSLSCVRQGGFAYSSLLEGFRRFKQVLFAALMQGIQYFAIGIISTYLSSILFTFTPYAAPVYSAAMQLMEDPTLDIYLLLEDHAAGIAVTYSLLCVTVFAVLASPVFYRFRLVNYLIMDDYRMSGLQAALLSRSMMHGRKLDLLKLDLSFWWYYGLTFLGYGLCFGLPIVKALGISLPFSEDVAHWGFQLLAVFTLALLHEFACPKVRVSYALAYEALRQPRKAQPPKAPGKQPWNYE